MNMTRKQIAEMNQMNRMVSNLMSDGRERTKHDIVNGLGIDTYNAANTLARLAKVGDLYVERFMDASIYGLIKETAE